MKISEFLAEFLNKNEILPAISDRDLGRSVAPQVKNLSDFYTGKVPDSPWQGSSKLAQLRQAYLHHYLPLGFLRMGAIWEELMRLGWKPRPEIRAIDLGAGPGSSALGISAIHSDPISWTWVDRDLPLMQMGAALLKTPPHLLKADLMEVLSKPAKGAVYDLWVANVALRELAKSPAELAPVLLSHWQRVLADEGLVILIEAGSQDASRWLLELRRELLAQIPSRKFPLTVLTPCLGTQRCGALENPKDWCHEVVTWNRSAEFRKLDKFTGMDHRTIDFSYLVLARSARPRGEILSALGGATCQRVVSPAHDEGRDQEFWVCGAQGKCKARLRGERDILRGDVLLDAKTDSSKSYLRIESAKVL